MVNENALESRIDKARELHKSGYNCCQCVLMAFPELHGLTNQQAAAISAGAGGGIGGQGEVCGVVSAMTMLAGLKHWNSPADKAEVYRRVRELSDIFKTRHGSLLCRELKCGKTPCQELIVNGVEIFANYIENAK